MIAAIFFVIVVLPVGAAILGTIGSLAQVAIDIKAERQTKARLARLAYRQRN